MNLNLDFLKSMNLNLVFSKSMNINLKLVFSKSMNLNFKIKKKMNGSNPNHDIRRAQSFWGAGRIKFFLSFGGADNYS